MRTRHKAAIIAPIVSFTLCAASPIFSVAQQNDPTASITAQIVKARDYTTEYVAIAKDSLAKNQSDLTQARKLYATAYSDYDSWVAYMRTALEDGRTKNLGKDYEYKQKAMDASTAATSFTNFVDSRTGESKAVNVLLTSIGALGLQLWNGIADRRQLERCIASANFEEMAKWYAWEAITDDTLKNPPASSQAVPSDRCKQAATSSSSGKNAPSAGNPLPTAPIPGKSQSPQP